MISAQSGAYQFALTEMENAARTAVLAAVLCALFIAIAIVDGWWPAPIVAGIDAWAIVSSGRRYWRLHDLADQANPHSDLSCARRRSLAAQAGAAAGGYLPGGLR